MVFSLLYLWFTCGISCFLFAVSLVYLRYKNKWFSLCCIFGLPPVPYLFSMLYLWFISCANCFFSALSLVYLLDHWFSLYFILYQWASFSVIFYLLYLWFSLCFILFLPLVPLVFSMLYLWFTLCTTCFLFALSLVYLLYHLFSEWSSFKVTYEEGLPNIWGNAKYFPIHEEAVSHMTFQLLHSEIPNIWGKFDFLFYQYTRFPKGLLLSVF